MTVSAQIDWDEENSPRAFWKCWMISQIILAAFALFLKLGIIRSYEQLRYGKGTEALFCRLLIVIPLLATAITYLILLMNGIWHRNPQIALANESATDQAGLSGLTLEATNPLQHMPPNLFEQSSLEHLDPVETRDEIQWKRILLATLGMASLVISVVAL